MRSAKSLRGLILVAAAVSLVAVAQEQKGPAPGNPGGGGKRGGQRPQDVSIDDLRLLFKTEVPAQPLEVVLGRPTAHAVTASVRAATMREGQIIYGVKAGALPMKTGIFPLAAGEPAEVELAGLPEDAAVFYRLQTRIGSGEWIAEAERTFHTARRAGSAFTFTIQADSHLDAGIDPAVYEKSLANVLAAKADFHIDLGDTFMTDKYPAYRLAAPHYAAQRYYFGIVGHSVPVFLVLGNHDGETRGKGRGQGSPDEMAVWVEWDAEALLRKSAAE